MANTANFKVKNGLVVTTTASIQSKVQSISTNTGALIVAGGAGIDGNIYAGKILNLSNKGPGTGIYISSSTSIYYSISFNGVTDYLYNASAPVLNVGAGDFSIEFWVNPNTVSGTQYLVSSYGSPGLDISIKDSEWFFETKSGMQYSGGAISASTWTHIAVTRQIDQIRTFSNGSLTNTYTVGDSYSGLAFIVGSFDTGPTGAFNGLLSDIRIEKGEAVYTTNFTIPDSALSSLNETTLLTANQSSIIDSSRYGFSVLTAGAPTIATISPYLASISSGIYWKYDGSDSWETSGGVSVSGQLSVNGPMVIRGQPVIYDDAPSEVDTEIVVLDSFDKTKFRSAKYLLSISNTATNQFETSEVWLVHDGSSAYIEQTSVFSNGGALLAVSATVSSNDVVLIAEGYNENNKIKIQRTYITV